MSSQIEPELLFERKPATLHSFKIEKHRGRDYRQRGEIFQFLKVNKTANA